MKGPDWLNSDLHLWAQLVGAFIIFVEIWAFFFHHNCGFINPSSLFDKEAVLDTYALHCTSSSEGKSFYSTIVHFSVSYERYEDITLISGTLDLD